MPPEPAAPIAQPAAAPSAPAAPAAPTPSPEPSAQDAFDKQFDLGGDEPAAPSAPPAPAAPAAPAAKPGAAAPAKPAAAPAKPAAAAPAAPAQEFEEVDGVKVPKFKSDKEFRGWGLNGYKKAKTLETDLQSLQNKYTELEQKIPKTEGERKQLADKLEALQKQYEETSKELNFANYERSTDYKDKYEKPYQDAIARAHRDVSELTITEEDRSQPADENGKFPTKERPAKPEDFDQIYSLPLGAATKLAAKKFGQESVSIIMQHRTNIRQAAEAAIGALKTWKDSSAKRAQETETQAVQTRERVAGLWTQVNADIKGKNPDLFAERPDDKDWNEKLTEGTKMADAYFSDRSQQPIEQRVVFDAHIRNRVAAFPALVSEVRRLKSQLEQANKDLTQLRGSGPGNPQIQDPNPPASESEGALSEFDKKF